MSNEQKLREALQLIAWSNDSKWQADCARQALALPTAEQVDDINVAESFTSVTKTDAPVGELPELPEPFALSVSVHDGEHCKWPLVECMLYQKHPNEKQKLYTADQMRAYARAALGAGDAPDAARYRWLADCNNYEAGLALIIDPKLTEQALGAAIDAAMRKDKP